MRRQDSNGVSGDIGNCAGSHCVNVSPFDDMGELPRFIAAAAEAGLIRDRTITVFVMHIIVMKMPELVVLQSSFAS